MSTQYALTDTAWVDLGAVPLSLQNAPVPPLYEPGEIVYVVANAAPNALTANPTGSLTAFRTFVDITAAAGNRVYARAANSFGAVALARTDTPAANTPVGPLTLQASPVPYNPAPGSLVGALQGAVLNERIILRSAQRRFYLEGLNLRVGSPTPSPGEHKLRFSRFIPGAAGPVDAELSVTVSPLAVAPTVLNALTLASSIFITTDKEGTLVGVVRGRSAGAEYTISPTDQRVTYGNGALYVGKTPASAGNLDVVLTETLNGVSKSTTFALTVVAGINPLALLDVDGSPLRDVDLSIMLDAG